MKTPLGEDDGTLGDFIEDRLADTTLFSEELQIDLLNYIQEFQRICNALFIFVSMSRELSNVGQKWYHPKSPTNIATSDVR